MASLLTKDIASFYTVVENRSELFASLGQTPQTEEEAQPLGRDHPRAGEEAGENGQGRASQGRSEDQARSQPKNG